MSSLVGRREFLQSAAALSLASLASALPRMDVGSDPPRNAHTAPNVLILLFDALSARHMSIYGYPRETTPRLTRFAQRAIVYHAHYAGGNYTTPGTASLLTGTYPWSHRALSFGASVSDPYPDRNLFKLLGGDARTTVAYTQNRLVQVLLNEFRREIGSLIDPGKFFVVKNTFSERLFAQDPNVALHSERFLLTPDGKHQRGSLIASLLSRLKRKRAEQALNKAHADLYPRGIPWHDFGLYFIEDAIDGIRDQLVGSHQPFVAYYHLLPPHDPYRTRREFIGRFEDGWTPPAKEPHFFSEGQSDTDLNRWRVEYDEFIAYVDAEFGRLYDALLEAGLLDNTYLVLTSDHGEMFERGIWAHLTPVLYEPVIRIPLLISKPGQDRREDVHTPTSCVDVLPTLLHTTGQPVPDWCEGQVLPAFDGPTRRKGSSVYVLEAKENRAYTPLTKATFALIKGPYKLIHYRGYEGYENQYELYDLANDPEEMDNLVHSNKSLARELQGELEEKIDEVNRPYIKP